MSSLSIFTPVTDVDKRNTQAISIIAAQTILNPFIVSCLANSSFVVNLFPQLTLGIASFNATIFVAPSNSTIILPDLVYCGFASGLGASYTIWESQRCDVPYSNLTKGQAYLFLTGKRSLADVDILAGPIALEIGLQP